MTWTYVIVTAVIAAVVAAIPHELLDPLHYLYMLARRFGFSVNDAVAANVEKLKGRVDRGTQRGSGDNR